ncbi:hypothetical protein RI367_001727 [Sorochytrium milnesiophthora]
MTITVTVVHDKGTTSTVVDRTQPLNDILKVIVCDVLELPDADPAQYCLRFADTDDYVNQDRLRSEVKEGDTLKLGPSPEVEVIDCIANIHTTDANVQKAALFRLQNRLKESDFVKHFALAGGVKSLIALIADSGGNTLAYSLVALLTLVEGDYSLDDIDPPFIHKLVSILVSENLVNICRPVTAILVKMLSTETFDANDSSTQAAQSKITERVSDIATTISEIEPLSVLVERLSASDYVLQLNSLRLINSLFRNTMVAKKTRELLIMRLYDLGFGKRVFKILDSTPSEDITKELMEFQRHFIHNLHERKKTPVMLPGDAHQQSLLDQVVASVPGPDTASRLRLLGGENIKKETERVGQLGLEMMSTFVSLRPRMFEQWVLELGTSPPDSVCSFVRACCEVTEVLCDMWEISTGVTTATTFVPALLKFRLIHALCVELLATVYKGIGGRDMTNSVGMVRSHARHVLRQEGKASDIADELLERDLLPVKQEPIRDRFLREMEEDDELMNKRIVRELREMAYKESYDFVRQQRIVCLCNGAWFALPPPPPGKDGKPQRGKHRYCRLSATKKSLHYADYADITEKRPAMEALTERVELSTLTDILTGTSSPIHTNPSIRRAWGDETPSVWCFSLMSSPETSVMDLICSTYPQFSEWTDGFNALFDRSIANRDTAEYITLLTDCQIRLQLMDLVAERIDIGTGPDPAVPALPTSDAFWYDDVGGVTSHAV